MSAQIVFCLFVCLFICLFCNQHINIASPSVPVYHPPSVTYSLLYTLLPADGATCWEVLCGYVCIWRTLESIALNSFIIILPGPVVSLNTCAEHHAKCGLLHQGRTKYSTADGLGGGRFWWGTIYGRTGGILWKWLCDLKAYAQSCKTSSPLVLMYSLHNLKLVQF